MRPAQWPQLQPGLAGLALSLIKGHLDQDVDPLAGMEAVDFERIPVRRKHLSSSDRPYIEHRLE